MSSTSSLLRSPLIRPHTPNILRYISLHRTASHTCTALIVHTALYHGPRIYRAIVNVKTEADDIHYKLMKMYPEVPDWWFLALLAVVFVFAVVSLEVYDTELPVWGYVISVLLPSIYIIPTAFIYAMTSQQVTINLLAELIPGYLFQGQPLPGMVRLSVAIFILLLTMP